MLMYTLLFLNFLDGLYQFLWCCVQICPCCLSCFIPHCTSTSFFFSFLTLSMRIWVLCTSQGDYVCELARLAEAAVSRGHTRLHGCGHVAVGKFRLLSFSIFCAVIKEALRQHSTPRIPLKTSFTKGSVALGIRHRQFRLISLSLSFSLFSPPPPSLPLCVPICV